MNKDLMEFDYVDAKGKHSHRVVWTISGPADRYFAVDLTEFDPEERDFYFERLNQIHADYLAEIKQLGLGSNYRYFKEEGVDFGHNTEVSKEL